MTNDGCGSDRALLQNPISISAREVTVAARAVDHELGSLSEPPLLGRSSALGMQPAAQMAIVERIKSVERRGAALGDETAQLFLGLERSGQLLYVPKWKWFGRLHQSRRWQYRRDCPAGASLQ